MAKGWGPKQYLNQKKNHPLYLQDKYDIAASAAPRCIAVQHIAAFWKESSRREPDAASTSCNTSNKWKSQWNDYLHNPFNF